MKPSFLQLNITWNADPNAPAPQIEVQGLDILLLFRMNPHLYPEFHAGDLGFLRFKNCTQYRLGSTNDEGWYRGQCRFSKLAPEWGEFYLITGNPASTEGPSDWHPLQLPGPGVKRHFLFYFRDETFECVAENCAIEPRSDNSIFTTKKTLLAPQ